jgi:hypothetical protein
MSNELVRVMYISKASRRMTKGELSDLLAGARERNTAHGITGLLASDSGSFAQVLEGPVEAIDRLLANIAKDPRHDSYMLLSRGEIENRYFENWAMDWASLDRFHDTRHSALRSYLHDHNIADRAVIVGALHAFVKEHCASRR